MKQALELISPKVAPPLDASFRPAVLANHAFLDEVAASGGGVPLVLGLERANGRSVFKTHVLPENHPRAEANLQYAERLLKFLLWPIFYTLVVIFGVRSL